MLNIHNIPFTNFFLILEVTISQTKQETPKIQLVKVQKRIFKNSCSLSTRKKLQRTMFEMPLFGKYNATNIPSYSRDIMVHFNSQF